MSNLNLQSMIGGWIIGDFEPSLNKNPNFEVGIKNYNAGEFVDKHYHKVAVEYTVIIEGIAVMNGIQYHTGDIVVVNPNQISDFRAITDVKTVVVKIPSVKNDKYLIND